MEKVTSIFSRSYSIGSSSPILGAVRHNGMSRALKPYLTLAAIAISGFLLFLATQHHEYISEGIKAPFKHFQSPQPTTSDDKKNVTYPDSNFDLPAQTVTQIKNSTLGFEKVLLLNIPTRTDKLDQQILSSSLTGFNFTVIEGVKDEDIDPKSYPWDWTDREAAPGNRGCWRAHMNAIQTIVHQGLSSALIIEDDSDWDVNIKSQLVSVAAATQKLVHQAEKPEEPHSPYGDGWDLLWLGYCASRAREDSERVLIHNDPTVPPPSKRWDMWEPGFNIEGITNSTRVVSKNNNAICTNAYAVSLAGAQKILYHVSYTPNSNAIDERYSVMCDSEHKDEFPDFECLHVFPSMINAGGKPGRLDGESDQPGRGLEEGEKVKMRGYGYSYNTIYSSKLNMGNLVQGLEPSMQWTDEEMGERDLDRSQGMEMVYQPDGWWGYEGQRIDEAERKKEEAIEKIKEEEEMKKEKKDGKRRLRK